MAQVKIYGLKSHLDSVRAELSEAIHHCMVLALKFPGEKRFQRFIALDRKISSIRRIARHNTPSSSHDVRGSQH